VEGGLRFVRVGGKCGRTAYQVWRCSEVLLKGMGVRGLLTCLHGNV